jgi:hypothetical protein
MIPVEEDVCNYSEIVDRDGVILFSEVFGRTFAPRS